MDDHFVIRAECQALMLDYVHYLDNGNGDAVSKLFTLDGVWDRQGKIIRGREELRKAVASLPPGLIMRHITSNLVVRIIDENHAEGGAYYISYRDEGKGPAGHAIPRPLIAAAFVGDYIFRFMRTPEGWRIAFHKAQRTFENEAYR